MTSGPTTGCFVLLIALVGCGGQNGESGSSAETTTATPDAVRFTEDDLVSFERGLTKEIEAVRMAQQQAASATDAQARGRAMQAQWEAATLPQGAAAANMDDERYRGIRTTVHEVLSTLDFQGKIDGPLSMDLSRADEQTKAKLASDPFATLSPESAAALRARMNRLTPLWIEYVTLTAVAG